MTIRCCRVIEMIATAPTVRSNPHVDGPYSMDAQGHTRPVLLHVKDRVVPNHAGVVPNHNTTNFDTHFVDSTSHSILVVVVVVVLMLMLLMTMQWLLLWVAKSKWTAAATAGKRST